MEVKINSIRNKISEFWGSKENTFERYGKGFHWVESSLVTEMINQKTSGEKNVDMVAYFIDNYLNKKKGDYVGLSLGCGTGYLERRFQSKKIFKRLEAVDLSEGVIEQAKESAKKEKVDIRYQVADLNKIKLSENKYDVIIANSSLHHIKNLEYIAKEINKGLKKDGVLFVSEFVGPSQFQYTEKQVKIINEILDLLPDVYRRSVTDRNKLKPEFTPSPLEYMNEVDPSEAVRSAEIVGILEKSLTVAEKKEFGGTLLHMLLQDIVGNFNPKDVKDATVLRLILYIEDVLIREGVLKSDFIFMILEKKST